MLMQAMQDADCHTLTLCAVNEEKQLNRWNLGSVVND